MIVDTHVHIWHIPPIAPVGPTAPRWSSVPTSPATAELLLEDMDANDVDYTVIDQTSFSTWDNSYVADAARQYPDRFVAQGLIDPLDPDNAKHAAYWMDERGMTGFRFHPGYYITDDPAEGEILTKPQNAPMFEAIQDRRGIVQIHCPAEYAHQMDTAVARYPQITWLIDHMMYPQPEMAHDDWAAYQPVLDLARHPNVLIKISDIHNRSNEDFPHADMHHPVKLAIDAFGIDRCMWGTDWTRAVGLLTYSEGVEAFRTTEQLSDSDRAALMGGTLQQVYGWKD